MDAEIAEGLAKKELEEIHRSRMSKMRADRAEARRQQEGLPEARCYQEVHQRSFPLRRPNLCHQRSCVSQGTRLPETLTSRVRCSASCRLQRCLQRS